MALLKVRWQGESPLLMHSDQLANHLSPHTKALKKLTAKRKKTDEDHEAIARCEFGGGIYWHKDCGPYLPAKNIRAALIGAAMKSKRGPGAREGLFVETYRVPLIYEGPRDIDGLWEAGFHFSTPARVQQAMTLRTRPCFEEWAAEFGLVYETDCVDRDEIVSWMERAGRLGICDYRPEKGKSGTYGTFSVAWVK